MIPVECREFLVQDHGNQAFTVMNDLRKKKQLSDVTLCVDQLEFYAHKVRVEFNQLHVGQTKLIISFCLSGHLIFKK